MLATCCRILWPSLLMWCAWPVTLFQTKLLVSMTLLICARIECHLVNSVLYSTAHAATPTTSQTTNKTEFFTKV